MLTFARFSSPQPLNPQNRRICVKPLPTCLPNALETHGGRKSQIRIIRPLEDIREYKSPCSLF
jgi:hypothetical protein